MPDINVTVEDAQPINVQLADAQPINVQLADVVQISQGGISGGSATYDIRDIDADATYKYFGFGERGGTNWRIMRKELATNAFRYAIGATDYSTNWTGRNGLVYN